MGRGWLMGRLTRACRLWERAPGHAQARWSARAHRAASDRRGVWEGGLGRDRWLFEARWGCECVDGGRGQAASDADPSERLDRRRLGPGRSGTAFHDRALDKLIVRGRGRGRRSSGLDGLLLPAQRAPQQPATSAGCGRLLVRLRHGPGKRRHGARRRSNGRGLPRAAGLDRSRLDLRVGRWDRPTSRPQEAASSPRGLADDHRLSRRGSRSRFRRRFAFVRRRPGCRQRPAHRVENAQESVSGRRLEPRFGFFRGRCCEWRAGAGDLACRLNRRSSRLLLPGAGERHDRPGRRRRRLLRTRRALDLLERLRSRIQGRELGLDLLGDRLRGLDRARGDDGLACCGRRLWAFLRVSCRLARNDRLGSRARQGRPREPER
jgi:hypothetical protein